MIVIRPIRLQDLEAYETFAFTTHRGVISLPKNKEALHKKLISSMDAFSRDIRTPGKELYLFIMEDLTSGQQIGTCGIWAKTGITESIYFYYMETIQNKSISLPVPKEMQILHTVSFPVGPAEICGLYILPDYRHGGLGRLLSLSRFLFIASFPERFDPVILSNMRGIIDDHDHSVFWDEFGSVFLEMEFHEVISKVESGSKDFIPEFLPKYPIYVSLLPKSVQEIIGKTHPHTKPALNMLLDEGFRYTNEIDIFDGGPIITAQADDIRTIKESKVGKVGKISAEKTESHAYIICNCSIDYRACFGNITLEEDQIVIAEDVAKALNVQVGDAIRYVTSGHKIA